MRVDPVDFDSLLQFQDGMDRSRAVHSLVVMEPGL